MRRNIAFALATSALALPASAAERKFDPDACARRSPRTSTTRPSLLFTSI